VAYSVVPLREVGGPKMGTRKLNSERVLSRVCPLESNQKAAAHHRIHNACTFIGSVMAINIHSQEELICVLVLMQLLLRGRYSTSRATY
jgi:hypothetical protein